MSRKSFSLSTTTSWLLNFSVTESIKPFQSWPGRKSTFNERCRQIQRLRQTVEPSSEHAAMNECLLDRDDWDAIPSCTRSYETEITEKGTVPEEWLTPGNYSLLGTCFFNYN
ncbi:hypothetical protein BDP55DRAFT_638216 [Colletotrichum godetiae]|uniref:Uncharacterized protein n=1 Tax=Colletotrichum godetiae TaxID=1209918 RepID=A0AAJ0EQX5_9PEZI|nr:uncharacterized protein BDP55DRAFT_638216 [Colletotrichum godetiae]KAK1658009.1 hypothetical protein BDP55DRAFT_638216 [Colletotrichum godetiae]